MNKASSSLFVLVLFAALATQVNAQSRGGHHGSGQGGYGQQGPAQVITQRISQSLRMREVRRVSELLRLSMSESMELNANSITLFASSLRNPAKSVFKRMF